MIRLIPALLLFGLSAREIYIWPESFAVQNGQAFSVAVHTGPSFPSSSQPPEEVMDATLHVAKYHYKLSARRVDGKRLVFDAVAKTIGNQILTAHSGSAFAKAIVNAELPGAFGMEPVGQELEIVPLSNPANALPGQPIRLQVVFLGKPLPGMSLRLTHTNGETREAKTGADGVASVNLPWPGAYRFAVDSGAATATLVLNLR